MMWLMDMNETDRLRIQLDQLGHACARETRAHRELADRVSTAAERAHTRLEAILDALPMRNPVGINMAWLRRELERIQDEDLGLIRPARDICQTIQGDGFAILHRRVGQ